MIAVTIYLTFCAFLILPHLGAPPIFPRMAIGLCASEFFAALGWALTSGACQRLDIYGQSSCADDDTFFASVAAVQIPALTGALFVVGTAYAVFVARRW